MKTITIRTQRERILLVEFLRIEYEHAYLTNRGRALLMWVLSFVVTAAVWLARLAVLPMKVPAAFVHKMDTKQMVPMIEAVHKSQSSLC